MSSERRLHPASILFAVLGHARNFVLPGLIFLLSSRGGGWGWELWAMLLIVPLGVAAAWQTLSFRYALEAGELVVRKGFFFKSERHIPYGRIQNVDAVQNVVHRLFRVAEVRIETGGAKESEAALRVVSLEVFHELRRRVFDEAEPAAGEAAGTAAASEEPLLRLPLREVVLYGLLKGRGMVIGAAMFGVLWEAGFIDRIGSRFWGGSVGGEGAVGELIRAFFEGGRVSLPTLATTLGAFAVFVLALQVLSVVWAILKLHGFTLQRTGDDLRLEYGLSPRVVATIPVRKIQSITVQEGPVQRLLGRLSVTIDTAGGTGGQAEQTHGQALAPLLRRERLPEFMAAVLPGLDPEVAFNPVEKRGFRRLLFQCVLVAVGAAALPSLFLRTWALVLLAVLLVWSVVHARRSIRALGWAVTDRAMVFRSGWLWRKVTTVPLSRIQAAGVRESPFDRRRRMASVMVDRAGMGVGSHRIEVPYLARDTADRLAAELAAHAGRS
ncbi:MAG TPA: PH domain-containing protein, partial [Longimicrobiaceae bacterium]|nr:PH domain-containing protein [Longimicrobiaceae bacterium]